ncbi:hypothetical protein Pfo_011607 [Paulownia fortunei]|nr:hypothetical protein Pfo_011607 [Paulownia fortunei]
MRSYLSEHPDPIMKKCWTRDAGMRLMKHDGQEEFIRLRPLSYRGADVFILAFSLINKGSYENAPMKT